MDSYKYDLSDEKQKKKSYKDEPMINKIFFIIVVIMASILLIFIIVNIINSVNRINMPELNGDSSVLNGVGDLLTNIDNNDKNNSNSNNNNSSGNIIDNNGNNSSNTDVNIYNEDDKDLGISQYNDEISSYIGKYQGVYLSDVINAVKEQNKKYTNRKLKVSYNDKIYVEKSELDDLSLSFDVKSNYNVNVEYDEEGYISVFVIEKTTN